MATASALGIATPYEEMTNYFGLWDSLEAEPIPYLADSLYEAVWLFYTNRETTDAAPSLRFRIGLNNHKAFSYMRLYPGDWVPLASDPDATPYALYFEPPVSAPALFLAFSLIDWTEDFRGTAPAGEVYLEGVELWRHELGDFEPWQPEASIPPEACDTWTTGGIAAYQMADCGRSTEGLSLTSGIDASSVFGCWDSPAALFSLESSKFYRLKAQLAGSEPLGGPELRLRVHTDDYRYAWFTYYTGSWTVGESALPPVEGKDHHLYLKLPTEQSQECRFSFDLIDFSSSTGGEFTLQTLALHSVDGVRP